jgi:hypothetical protein
MLVNKFNLSQSFNYTPHLFYKKTVQKSEINSFCIWTKGADFVCWYLEEIVEVSGPLAAAHDHPEVSGPVPGPDAVGCCHKPSKNKLLSVFLGQRRNMTFRRQSKKLLSLNIT